MQSEVNIKHVLGLEENPDKTLQLVQIEIPQSSNIIKELEAMMESPSKNLYDMNSYFYRHVKPIKYCYNFCFPEEYYYPFLNERVTPLPELISYKDYKEIEGKRRNRWEKWLAKEPELTPGEKEIRWNNYVHKIEYSDKKQLFSKAKKYILCQNLDKAMQQAKNNPNIKIYSRDTVGFKCFLYDIDDDVKVAVNTNFGYGRRTSYFFLTIKYKDIVLIPYSDLVHFYYANMKSLIAHTRSYMCNRDSWSGLLNFLSVFVNNSRRDPENFVRNYVLNEIEVMMTSLRAILKNPSEILKHMQSDNGENIRLSVVRPFNKNDFEIFEAIPDELTSVFKIEKISGALHFVENLKSLKNICSEVDAVIEEIIELNKTVAPEIPGVLESIDNSIKPLQDEYNIREKDYNKKTNELSRFEKRLDYRLSYCKSSEAKKKCIELFKNQNPRYEAVIKEKNELVNVMYQLKHHLDGRNKLRNRLVDCSTKMDTYITRNQLSTE